MAGKQKMVLLVSVDGMRPDGMMEADTPTIDALIANGAYTLAARTVMPSVTLPCHTSMLRGVDVPRHGVTSNTFAPLARPVPSVIDVAHRAGRRTGFFYNWGELRDLCEPGSLDVAYFRQDAHRPEGDQHIAAAASAHLKEQAFDFLFVYLGYTDECGHEKGWMSKAYIDAIGNADFCIGQVLTACTAANIDPTVLLLSDHGGHGQSHGTDCAEDITIPWILSGPGVKPGELHSEVRIFDTCTTLAALLDLPADRTWEGRIVTEALLQK